MPKTRMNVSLDQDIADFARMFAAENRVTVADLMTQYLLNLKRKVEGRNAEFISRARPPGPVIMPVHRSHGEHTIVLCRVTDCFPGTADLPAVSCGRDD